MAADPHESQNGALADTCVELKSSGNGGKTPEGRGCLLQLYPVSRLHGFVRLGTSRCVLGRDSACHITVDESSVSRMHAAVEWSNGAYHITDLNSTNGSWVNNVRLTEQVTLAGGELIRLGNTILKFMLALDEEAQYYSVVHDLMTRDALTNAFNRGYLLPLVTRELQACRDHGGSVSLILMDIDRFKRINDRCGHLIGDDVLRTLCERIRPVLDESQHLCRFGGDEFAVVCPQTPLEMTAKIAEMIRREVADSPFVTQAGKLKVTCSVGVTSSDGHALADVDALLSAADKLLYKAKQQGRNCVHRADGASMARSSSR